MRDSYKQSRQHVYHIEYDILYENYFICIVHIIICAHVHKKLP